MYIRMHALNICELYIVLFHNLFSKRHDVQYYFWRVSCEVVARYTLWHQEAAQARL